MIPNDLREYECLIKLRLVHLPDRSIFLVDQVVVVSDGEPYWLQPQWTDAPQVFYSGSRAVAAVSVAVVGTCDRQSVTEVEVKFWDDSLVASLSDRAHVYRAKLFAPVDLRRHIAGAARLRTDGGFDLQLFHHTRPSSKVKIQESGEVWGSKWNFQGTREVVNVSYAYFTSIPEVRGEADLHRMAMASNGRIQFRLDQSPIGARPDLELKVLRARTSDRPSTLALWVPAEHVSPPHMRFHAGPPASYETAQPFIYRLGLRASGSYRFAGDVALVDQTDLRRFDYVILGDCSTIEGLRAPYDEENTEFIFEIQDLGDQTIHEFWWEHQNQPLYTGEMVMQELADPTD